MPCPSPARRVSPLASHDDDGLHQVPFQQRHTLPLEPGGPMACQTRAERAVGSHFSGREPTTEAQAAKRRAAGT